MKRNTNNEVSMNKAKVTMPQYKSAPERYELRSGLESDAPLCPYGNRYQWVGYDKQTGAYVRFAESVFKKLIRERSG